MITKPNISQVPKFVGTKLMHSLHRLSNTICDNNCDKGFIFKAMRVTDKKEAYKTTPTLWPPPPLTVHQNITETASVDRKQYSTMPLPVPVHANGAVFSEFTCLKLSLHILLIWNLLKTRSKTVHWALCWSRKLSN